LGESEIGCFDSSRFLVVSRLSAGWPVLVDYLEIRLC
jgi:hypothetical protein